ncbi:unnamed protein product [Taenia asiatica]|uniref:AIP3 domain-containing protein n=1 Tax=Taenia asiatica TaxID=60517 RepID=A0A158R7U0_TAEAS|nr:unnamed protein product [Taenia asiatica]
MLLIPKYLHSNVSNEGKNFFPPNLFLATMDAKATKKKSFWRLVKHKNSTTLKPVEAATTNGTLRSLFMDDTALSRSMRSSSLAEPDVGVPRFRRPLRECRSICVPSAAEQTFLQEINNAGLSTQAQVGLVRGILVIRRKVLGFGMGEIGPGNGSISTMESFDTEQVTKQWGIVRGCRGCAVVSELVRDSREKRSHRPTPQRRDARKPTTALDQLAHADIDWTVDWTNACQLQDIHVWHQHQLFRVNRVFKESQSNESDFLKKLFAILLPKEPIPVDITSTFQVLDERRKLFRPIHPNEIFPSGSLLKLLRNTKAESNPRHGSAEACILSQQSCPAIHQGSKISDVPPAPLLGRKYSNSIVGTIEKQILLALQGILGRSMSWIKFQEEVEGKKKVAKEEGEEPKSNSLPSSDVMHSQVPSGGTPTRLPIHPTLIPATMQVGSNGERHLILHYPDGHSVATTALPNQSGQFHLVPMLNQPQVQSSQTTLRLIQTAGDFSHTNRQPLGMHLEGHGHLVKKKSGQKVELVCTCPPELHNVTFSLRHRIAYMENQLTQLTAWVRAAQAQDGLEGDSGTPFGPSADWRHYIVTLLIPLLALVKDNDSAVMESKHLLAHCPSGYERCPHPPLSPHPHQSNRQRLLNAYKELKELRLDLYGLKETHAANTHQMRSISNSFIKEITQLLNASKSKGATPVRLVQLSLDSHMADYKAGRREIEAWLKDLDACIEEMRVDALNRRCRVSVAEVEAYALHLSRLSQRLASFKGQIPEICNASNLLSLVNEAEVKVQNELLLDEQKRIDVTLSTCKQLTCTLFTLKRLAAVQENGISVNIPTFRTIRDPRPEDKKLYLQQISKIIPNHEARMVGLACHEKTRERRKRMLSLHESVYLERAIEQSESNLQEILQRLNELSLDLLSSSPEQSEEEGMNQAPPFVPTPSSSRICPIHQAGSKAAEPCCTHCEALRSGKSCRGSGDGESSTSPSSASSEQNAVGVQLPPPAPPLLPSLPQAPRGPRRAHVVFSRTVLVDAGRETTRLNCPSDLDDDHLDDTGDTGSEAEEPQLWRRERLHRGNRVVDIHPGLPRNEYVICDGRCGAPTCAQGSCLARQKGSTGSVLKTTTAYGSSPHDRNQLASQFSSTTATTTGDFDSKSVDSEESEKQLAEPTSVHEMRAHHQCCRLNNSSNPPSTN